MGKLKTFSTKILSLMIAFIMLFNLTAPVFAAPQIATKEQKNQITRALNEALNNNNPSIPDNKDLTYYNNQYQAALENYANIKEQFEPLYKAINTSKNIMDLVTITPETQKKCNKFSQIAQKFDDEQTSYNRKVEELGGVEKIKENYSQYQTYQKELAELQKEIENQQKLGNKDIADIKKEYKAKQKIYEQLGQELSQIVSTEEYLSKKSNYLIGLQNICNQPLEAKEYLLAALSGLDTPEELTMETDFNEILKVAQELKERLQTEYEKAEQQLTTTGKNLEEATEKDLNNRLDNFFEPANSKICQENVDILGKYSQPASYGKIDGQDVPLDPYGETYGRFGHNLSFDVHPAEIFKKEKAANLSCTNQPWNEQLLQAYNAGITMEELSYIKYGEYMVSYKLAEWDGKNITPSEELIKGEDLARSVILKALNSPDEKNLDEATVLHNELMGDYYQTKYLMDFLTQDWVDKGYGTIDPDCKKFNDEGELDTFFCFIVNSEHKYLENSALKASYHNRRIMFHNVRRILTEYYWELFKFFRETMNYLAKDGVKPADLQSFLENRLTLNSCQGDDEQYAKALIARLEEATNLSESDKKSNLKEEYQKKHANDGILDDIFNGIDKICDNYCQNKAKINLESYDWDHSVAIKTILTLFAIVFPTRNVYKQFYQDKRNLEAWDALGEKLSKEKAQGLLNYMVGVGHSLEKGTDESIFGSITHHYDGLLEKSSKKHASALEKGLHEKTLFGIVAEIVLNVALVVAGGGSLAKLRSGSKIALKNMMKQGYKISLKIRRGIAGRNTSVITDKRYITKRNELLRKIDNITKDVNHIKSVNSRLGGKFHFTSPTGWVKEAATEGSIIHQFERQFGDLLGINNVKPYVNKSRIFTSPKPDGLPDNDFIPIAQEEANLERISVSQASDVAVASQTQSKKSLWQKISGFKDKVKKQVATSIVVFSMFFNPLAYGGKNIVKNVAGQEVKATTEAVSVKQTTQKTIPEILTNKVNDQFIKRPARLTPVGPQKNPERAGIPLNNRSPFIVEERRYYPYKDSTKKYYTEGGAGERPSGNILNYPTTEKPLTASKPVAKNTSKKTAVEQSATKKPITENTRKPVSKQTATESTVEQSAAKKPAISKKSSRPYQFNNENSTAIPNNISATAGKPIEVSQVTNPNKKQAVNNLIEKSSELQKEISSISQKENVTTIVNSVNKKTSQRLVPFKKGQSGIPKELDAYINKVSSGKYPTYADLEEAMAKGNQEAWNIFRKNLAIDKYDVELGAMHIPGEGTKVLIAPSQKIAANMSKEEGLICFSTTAGKTGELGKYVEVLNTHGVDPMYYDRLLKGDVGAIINRSNGDYLVIYDIVGKNGYGNQYLIGIIRNDESANAYRLITNYSVYANQLSKEIGSFGKVIFLRQPTVKTGFNKGFVNSLLKDMGR